jgi:hypothetical protein
VQLVVPPQSIVQPDVPEHVGWQSLFVAQLNAHEDPLGQATEQVPAQL